MALFGLRGRLMAQMAIRAASVMRRIMMIPVADHTRGKRQQGDERQRDAENTDYFTHKCFTNLDESKYAYTDTSAMISRCRTHVKRCPLHSAD